MSLNQLVAALEQQHRAPVEQWDPPYCGDIPIRIDGQGKWYYRESEITRQPLVKLFASVLRFQRSEDGSATGDYFLITPAEKVRIQVDDLPFIISAWQWVAEQPPATDEANSGGAKRMQLFTNIDERYILSAKNPLIIDKDLPAVRIRDGLLARVHRNVFYQWADIATPAESGERSGYYISSGAERFWLGAEN